MTEYLALKEHIVEARLDKFAMRNMRIYGAYTIEQRALPDWRDGLKPVQRRILWAAYILGVNSKSGFKKSARIVGDTMGKFHPHGDCLSATTIVPLLSGKHLTIKELVDSNAGPKWVLSWNPKTKTLVPAKAHSWRVGKTTKIKYRIHFNNGDILECTGNHQFLSNKGWIKAKNITLNTQINSGFINTEFDYWQIYTKKYNGTLHGLVGDSKFEFKEEDQIYHHFNENITDNRPSNLILLNRGEHALHHQDYKTGLDNGRVSMFSKIGKFRKAIKKKNRILMREYNKNLPIIKAFKAVALIIERGWEVNEANYIALQKEGVIYNLTGLDTLKNKGYSLNRILNEKNFELDTSKAVGLTKKVLHINKEIECDTTRDYSGMLHKAVSNVIKVCISVLPITEVTWNFYEEVAKSIAEKNKGKVLYANTEHLKKAFNVKTVEELASHIRPHFLCFVSQVEKIKLDVEETFYDFTVDGYENMIVMPSDSKEKTLKNFYVTHNSGIYTALVNMANTKQFLIEGQGNFGPLNTQPAADRYTEMRLSAYADACMFSKPHLEINEMVSNYDGSEKEPLVLPALLPNLLINGGTGMAVGVVFGVPFFTAKSVVKLMKAVLNDKKITIDKIANMLELNYRYGGKLLDPERLKLFFETGESAITILPDYEYDSKENKIIITGGGPFLDVSWITNKLNEFEIVKRVDDYTSNPTGKAHNDGFLLEVFLIDTAQARGSVELLMRKIADSITLRFNLTHRLPNGEDVDFFQTNIIDYLKKWCNWRLDLESKTQLNIAANLDKQIRHTELLILGAENVDAIIKEVKKKEDRLSERLSKLLKITIEEADYLKRRAIEGFSGLNRIKLLENKKQFKTDKLTALSIAKTPTDHVIKSSESMLESF